MREGGRTPGGEADAAAQAAAGTYLGFFGPLGVDGGGGVHQVISQARWASWAHQCAIRYLIVRTLLAALAWRLGPRAPIAKASRAGRQNCGSGSSEGADGLSGVAPGADVQGAAAVDDAPAPAWSSIT